MKGSWAGIIFALLLVCVVPSRPERILAQSGDIRLAVIVHADNTIKADDYGKDELKKIFLKQTAAWPDTVSIIPYQLASGTSEAELFRKEVLGKDSKELTKYWSDKKADDGISEPVSKKTSDEIFKLVTKEKAAIGYINKSYLDGMTEEEKKRVKVLLTI